MSKYCATTTFSKANPKWRNRKLVCSGASLWCVQLFRCFYFFVVYFFWIVGFGYKQSVFFAGNSSFHSKWLKSKPNLESFVLFCSVSFCFFLFLTEFCFEIKPKKSYCDRKFFGVTKHVIIGRLPPEPLYFVWQRYFHALNWFISHIIILTWQIWCTMMHSQATIKHTCG